MVEQITAFRDSEGNLHETKLAAARADARIQLGKIFGGNSNVVVTAVLENAGGVFAALLPLADTAHETGDLF